MSEHAKQVDVAEVLRTTLRVCSRRAGPMLLACAIAIREADADARGRALADVLS